jgi:hypothetical protein
MLLPSSYSQDFNPIELTSFNISAFLKKAVARYQVAVAVCFRYQAEPIAESGEL